LRCFIDHLPWVRKTWEGRGREARVCPMPDRESVRDTGMVW
jgi:hypothetical protein